MQLDPARVDIDRLANAPEVGESAGIPDDRIRIGRRPVIRSARLGQLRLVALPGGRSDPEDATLQDTAIRETFEETGLDLATDGVVLGMLDELRPRTPVLPPIIVTPFVMVTAGDKPLQISDELADAFWVPWSTFEDPTRLDESTVHVRGASWTVTSYLVGDRVVWGMTERMLRQLATRIRALGAV